MTRVRAIRNHIIFRMEDGVTRHMNVEQFEEITNWGFSIVRSEDSTSKARWGTVIEIGPEVPDDIYPGMRILIEPLKWTNYVEFEGERYWRTDYDSVLAVDENSKITL